MAIPDHARVNFETLLQAAQAGDLALMECTYSPGDIVILRDSIGHEMFFI